MFYNRQIRYLDYLENKERIRGVGFVKIEVRDNVCELHIQVNGMHVTDNFARKLMLVGEEEEAILCEIAFEKGRGSVSFQNLDSRNLAGSGIAYMQLYGIRIPIAAGKEIYCAIRERKEGEQSVAIAQQEQRQPQVGRREFEQEQAAQLWQPIGQRAQTAREERIQEGEIRERKAQEKELLERAAQEAKSQVREAQEKELWERIAQEDKGQAREVKEEELRERTVQEDKGQVKEAKEKELWKRTAQEDKGQVKEAKEKELCERTAQEDKGQVKEAKEKELWERTAQEDKGQAREAQEKELPEREIEEEKNREKRGEEISEAAEDDVIAQNIEEFVKKAMQSNMQEPDGQELNSGKSEREVEEQEPRVGSQKLRDANQPSASKGLQENKWKQLAAIYPHIRPFRDDRDYLSISPGDFVILTEKYYNMANNSFLLHGYYNYKHLILNRLEKRGNISYYVGVPGNFYEKEKQVALLFGFESFECAEEPARAGDYGYYMMKVEL